MRTTFSESIHTIGLRSLRSWDKCDNHAAIRVLVLHSPISADSLPKPGLPSSERHDANNLVRGAGPRIEGAEGNLLSIWRGVSTTQLLLGTHGPWMQNSELRAQTSEWGRMENGESRMQGRSCSPMISPSANLHPQIPRGFFRGTRGGSLPCAEVLICRMQLLLRR